MFVKKTPQAAWKILPQLKKKSERITIQNKLNNYYLKNENKDEYGKKASQG